MTTPWHTLKEIRPRSRDDLIHWAQGRKVAVVGWIEKDLYLINLRKHEQDELVRGDDSEGHYVVEKWNKEWKAVGE